MKKLIPALAILGAIALAGCIGPTTYHPFNGTDGYSEVQFTKTLYRIRVSGNDATSPEAVNNMLLYRSAEVAREQGYPYFKVLSKSMRHQKTYFTQPGESDTYVTKNRHHKHSTTYHSPPTTTVAIRYQDTMRIRLLRRRTRESDVYNASLLLDSLRPQIQFPPKPK